MRFSFHVAAFALGLSLSTAVLAAPAAGSDPDSRAAQAEPAPAPQKSQTAGEQPEVLDFSGRWYTDFGYVEIEQAGKEVRGTYSCCGGEIHGLVKGKMLEFFWKDPIYGDGWGHFYLKEEGRRLFGGWGTQDDMGLAGAWSGVRLGDLEGPAGEGEPRRYQVEARHARWGDLQATALLWFAGGEIRGRLEGGYVTTARGKPFRREVLYPLTGRSEGEELNLEWLDPISGVAGRIALTAAEDRFEGRWQMGEESGSQEIVFTPLPEDEEKTGEEKAGEDSLPVEEGTEPGGGVA